MINIHLALSLSFFFNIVRILAFEVPHCSNPYRTDAGAYHIQFVRLTGTEWRSCLRNLGSHLTSWTIERQTSGSAPDVLQSSHWFKNFSPLIAISVNCNYQTSFIRFKSWRLPLSKSTVKKRLSKSRENNCIKVIG